MWGFDRGHLDYCIRIHAKLCNERIALSKVSFSLLNMLIIGTNSCFNNGNEINSNKMQNFGVIKLQLMLKCKVNN